MMKHRYLFFKVFRQIEKEIDAGTVSPSTKSRYYCYYRVYINLYIHIYIS